MPKRKSGTRLCHSLFVVHTALRSVKKTLLLLVAFIFRAGCRALYELMFRAEPRKHVSRSTFLTVMRRVYGFCIAPLTGHVDQTALHTLGEVRPRCLMRALFRIFIHFRRRDGWLYVGDTPRPARRMFGMNKQSNGHYGS